MPSLGTLLPDGDSAVGSWLTDSGGNTNLWQKIEETIASATDANDYIVAPVDVQADYKCTLANTPAGFGKIATCLFNVRYALSAAPPASSKDTYGLAVRLVNGATILAAADSGGTFQTIVSTTTMATTYANSGATAFTYVNTTASKTLWDGAVVELRQTYTQSGSKDVHAVRVSALEITGTYNLTLAGDTGAFTLTGGNGFPIARRKLAGAAGAFTLTAGSGFPIVAHKVGGGTGTFTLTGGAADFLRTSSGPTYALAGGAGSFTLTAGSGFPVVARKLSGGAGSYTVSGGDGFAFISRKLAADSGAFVLTGGDGFAVAARKAAGDTGSFALTGGGGDFYLVSPPDYTIAGETGAFVVHGAPLRVFLQRNLGLRQRPSRGRRLGGRKVHP
jgi:hypothetical protein